MKILILPGWEHTSREWGEVASLLRQSHDVDVVDFPGFLGDWERYTQWGVPEYAQWLQDSYMLSEYDTIVAHSFGGRVIVDVIAKTDYQPKKLVLAGTPLTHISRRGMVYDMVMPIARALLPQSLKDRVLEKINPDVLDAKAHGNYESFKRVVGYDQADQLESVVCETLLVWGGRDEPAPLEIGKYLRDHIANARLDILTGVGHNIHLEKPVLLYGKITSFMESS